MEGLTTQQLHEETDRILRQDLRDRTQDPVARRAHELGISLHEAENHMPTEFYAQHGDQFDGIHLSRPHIPMISHDLVAESRKDAMTSPAAFEDVGQRYISTPVGVLAVPKRRASNAQKEHFTRFSAALDAWHSNPTEETRQDLKDVYDRIPRTDRGIFLHPSVRADSHLATLHYKFRDMQRGFDRVLRSYGGDRTHPSVNQWLQRQKADFATAYEQIPRRVFYEKEGDFHRLNADVANYNPL
jgi:hypothetical protein